MGFVPLVPLKKTIYTCARDLLLSTPCPLPVFDLCPSMYHMYQRNHIWRCYPPIYKNAIQWYTRFGTKIGI